MTWAFGHPLRQSIWFSAWHCQEGIAKKLAGNKYLRTMVNFAPLLAVKSLLQKNP
jgi:hypothetical protein